MEIREGRTVFKPKAEKVAVNVEGAPADLPPIRCKSGAEFLNAPEPDDLLEKIVQDGEGAGTTYGAPGSAKSFLMLDMMVAMARTDAERSEYWHGFRLTEKPVPCVYVVAEGVSGARKRYRAILQHLGLTDADVLLEFVDTAVNLLTQDTDDLITAIRDTAERLGKPGFICLDTLAGTMAGGDENSGQDMGLYLSNVRRLAAAFKCFCMIVHHSGKDATRGARGHSSLKGNIDVELEVTRDDPDDWRCNRTLHCRKLRDDGDGEAIGFRLERVVLGQNKYGKDVTSCVVIPTKAAPVGIRRKPPTPTARHALRVLTEVIADHGQRQSATATIPAGVLAVTFDEWRQRYYLRVGDDGSADPNRETARKYFTRARKELSERGLIGISGATVWVIARDGTP